MHGWKDPERHHLYPSLCCTSAMLARVLAMMGDPLGNSMGPWESSGWESRKHVPVSQSSSKVNPFFNRHSSPEMTAPCLSCAVCAVMGLHVPNNSRFSFSYVLAWLCLMWYQAFTNPDLSPHSNHPLFRARMASHCT